MRPTLWPGLALALGACGGAASPAPAPHAEPAGSKPAGPAHSVERYFPLQHDAVFKFETRDESTGERGVLVMRVHRPSAELAGLDIGGKKRRLTVQSDGIRQAEGGYLLKLPIQLGASWLGRLGQVRVTAVEQIIDVPAGRFVGCFTTEESTSNKRVSTTFCPDVGMVAMDLEGMVDGDYARQTVRLVSFGQHVDLGEPGVRVIPPR